MAEPLLVFSHVGKSFSGVPALQDVCFEVVSGDCLALVGENGAGKSTLMKILSGVWPHGTYEGEVSLKGQPLRLTSPLDGRRCGISIIHQELCLFPELSVAENLFLTEKAPYQGQPSQALFAKVDWPLLYKRAEELFSDLGFQIDARAKLNDLSVAQRQLVEIAKAFHHRAQVVILDEPTSALSRNETEHLFKVIERLREKVTFLYISHKLDEVFRLSNRILVLRDGRSVAELDPKKITESEVIRHMVGRPVHLSRREGKASSGDAILEVQSFSHVSPAGKPVLANIQFSVEKGEVLGIAGLMGSGRSELLRSLLGLLPGERSGRVSFEGTTVEWNGMEEAMQDGVGFVPEDRKKDGLFLDHGVDFNLTLTVLRELVNKWGKLNLHVEQERVGQYAQSMAVKCGRYQDPIRTLSGGNQQKVLLAKVMARHPKVLLLDEPTRGIDVGAKEEIYGIIRDLAKRGLSILVVSSELPEILSLCDRVLVLKEGRLVGTLRNDSGLTQEIVMAYAAGTELQHDRAN